MPEVVEAEVVESPDAPAEEPEATQTTDELTTWKARLAGKDRALTDAKKELERAKKDAADLARWKAEREQADLTEVERLQLRINELETESASAKAQAKALSLQKEFPLAAEFLGDDISAFNEAKLADIEERLKAKSEPEEPRIDPNQPRRTTGAAKATEDKSTSELLDDLKRIGNPYSASTEEATIPKLKLTPR